MKRREKKGREGERKEKKREKKGRLKGEERSDGFLTATVFFHHGMTKKLSRAC
jgi:hypothetical protein